MSERPYSKLGLKQLRYFPKSKILNGILSLEVMMAKTGIVWDDCIFWLCFVMAWDMSVSLIRFDVRCYVPSTSLYWENLLRPQGNATCASIIRMWYSGYESIVTRYQSEVYVFKVQHSALILNSMQRGCLGHSPTFLGDSGNYVWEWAEIVVHSRRYTPLLWFCHWLLLHKCCKHCVLAFTLKISYCHLMEWRIWLECILKAVQSTV